MMKKSFLKIGACSAVVWGSLAYATTGQGVVLASADSVAMLQNDTNGVVIPSDSTGVNVPSDSTGVNVPSDSTGVDIPQVEKMEIGVSIGTVDAIPYADSGLHLNYFGFADYVAKVTENTYMGFELMEDSENPGNMLAVFNSIQSTEESVTIPDSIRVDGQVIPVSQIYDQSNQLSDAFKYSKIRNLTIPATVKNVKGYRFYSYLDGIYMLGEPPYFSSNVNFSGTIYVCNKDMYALYTNNQQFSYCVVMPYGWDFDYLTVAVNRKGEFAQTYIEMTDANWALGVYVKVTGELNEADLKNMSKLTALQKLDLSEAEFTELPESFMSYNRTLTEVTLPQNLLSISRYAFSDCSNLTTVNAPEVVNVMSNAFEDCEKLQNFDISRVIQIGQYAFNNCQKFIPTLSPELTTLGSYAFRKTAIKEVVIPQTITSLASYVFSNCTELTKVTLPSTLTVIESNCFENCSKLQSVEFFEGLISIDSNAFAYCSQLTSINLPEGLTNLGYNAFSNCSKLSEVTLPSTLQTVGTDLVSNCPELNTVKCKAVVPPMANGNISNGTNMDFCTLYVAPFAIDAYRNAEGWGSFYIMKPLNEPVKNIYVNRPVSFDLQSEDNAVLQDNPNLTLAPTVDYWGNLNYVGELSASGDGTLSAGIFKINHVVRTRSTSSSYYEAFPTLINNAENMRADSVICEMQLEENKWHFISFQYDVQMADIIGLMNTDFVIRQYNGEKRASGDSINTGNWEPVPADGVLKAGKGYIIQAANNQTVNNNDVPATVAFPSRNTVTKNNLFTPNNIAVTLDEYPAEFAHNRSWNLVGNPYPCYFNMHNLMNDFMTPIVLWRGTNYQAYSPIDDDIILRPNEAFFVQKPLDADQMVFAAEGRMHYSEAINSSQNVTPGIKSEMRGSASRAVFNFNIEGCGTNDRARIVMNEEAEMDYELNRDAAKFFASESVGAEIYVDGNVKYGICERPLNEGIATLGMRIGTKGQYTISLSGRNIQGWTVMLTDTQTGTTIDLNKESYTFDAENGTASERFVLTFKNGEVSAVEGVETSAANENVRVVNTAGITVFNGKLNDFKATAPMGVYIVVEAGKAYKLVVK